MPILSLSELSRGEGRVDDGIPPDDPLWEGLAIVLLEVSTPSFLLQYEARPNHLAVEYLRERAASKLEAIGED